MVQVGLRGAAGMSLTRPILRPVLSLCPSLRRRVGGESAHLHGVLGWGVYRAVGVLSRQPAAPVETREVVEPEATASMMNVPDQAGRQSDGIASSPRDPDGTSADQDDPTAASRSHSALALPLSGMTIDGRLDDWPGHLRRHPIRNQFLGHETYDSRGRGATGDPDGYFMVGYDRGSALIYVAVVVKDAENVLLDDVKRADDRVHFETDAVEVFVDGNHSDRKYEWKVPPTSGDWHDILKAAELPVLQYVAVPGPTPAYADRTGANPTLMYGRIQRTGTVMKSRRKGDITTYEWAVQAFDRYPDRPTRLDPGKRIGFEVAIVNKDPGAPPPI